MSLLLDALKKAAEKNQTSDVPSPQKEDATKLDATEVIDKTQLAEKTAFLQDEKAIENVTEYELAQIISAQKNSQENEPELVKEPVFEQRKDELADREEELSSLVDAELDSVSIEDETDIQVAKLDIESLEVDSDPSLALYEDDDPSLKLSISDEEILLTDDDVTEFLGGDELSLHLSDSGLSMEDKSELQLEDKTTTQSLNLVEPPTEFTHSKEETTTGLGFTSITGELGQTTNLNSLTNDATLTIQDSTSTHTFASDNYDRTLVKLDEDVSKVFTGMKSSKSGVAMTPDFAKKVFVHKSSSLRRKNYKIYGVISILVLFTIAVFALFEMQSQIEDIDTSLVRLNQNPVPSSLRFKRQEVKTENNAVLQGKVDTEALNLLKSLSQNNVSVEQANENLNANVNEAEIKESNIKTAAVKEELTNNEKKQELGEEDNLQVSNKIVEKDVKTKTSVKSEKVVVSSVTANKPIKTKKQPASKAKKTPIKIKSNIVISKESIWLKDAYKAFERGDLELAAMNYSRVLDKNADNRDALLGQAAIFSVQNKSAQAIDNYQRVLLANPKDPLAMTSLITASSMSPIESESRLKLLQRESPKATYLQFALGNVVSAQNRWKEAQQYYFKAYQAEPNNPDYAYNLAVSLEQVNKPKIAINYYGQAIENAQTTHASFDINMIKQRIEVLSQ